MEAREIMRRADEIREDLVVARRVIHAHPEIGFHEHRTSSFVESRLLELGIETRRVAGTGVVGVLRGSLPGAGVGLRADMDALPISEKNEAPYRSQNPGVMHACGHDAHVACLLGAAAILAAMRERIPGTVTFLFQPAEESDGGALPMVEGGRSKTREPTPFLPFTSTRMCLSGRLRREAASSTRPPILSTSL